ncbi:hypothetical protein QR98_0043960 [Sarcoptes scabiei]|uniref:Uncharacterized protein n=1 Tax=Sarcoptes scabiei TaxID=52283 RepID=A0A132A4T1_SARSC|nr:hypothetical protein QR98_0043960 [Sarcoptes scabiei]
MLKKRLPLIANAKSEKNEEYNLIPLFFYRHIDLLIKIDKILENDENKTSAAKDSKRSRNGF